MMSRAMSGAGGGGSSSGSGSSSSRRGQATPNRGSSFADQFNQWKTTPTSQRAGAVTTTSDPESSENEPVTRDEYYKQLRKQLSTNGTRNGPFDVPTIQTICEAKGIEYTSPAVSVREIADMKYFEDANEGIDSGDEQYLQDRRKRRRRTCKLGYSALYGTDNPHFQKYNFEAFKLGPHRDTTLQINLLT